MPFDFFSSPELARPPVGDAQALELLRDRFGIEPVPDGLRELGSQQDRNFRVTTGDGRYLLKIVNPVFTRTELEAQVAALGRLSAAGLVVQQPVTGLDGDVVQEVSITGTRLTAYVASFLDGVSVRESAYLAPSVVSRMGELAGRMVAGLSDFEHAGTDRTLQWDLRFGRQVVDMLQQHVVNPVARARLTNLAVEAQGRLAPLQSSLRAAVIHGDLTLSNVVCRPDEARRQMPYGVIDLGDLHRGWLVAELAVTCSSMLDHFPESPLSVLPAVRAFHELVPLDDAEVSALWPLIALRTAVLGVSDAQQLAIEPDNAYVEAQTDRQARLFTAVTALPFVVAEEAVRVTLGMPPAHHAHWPPPAADVAAMVPSLGDRRGTPRVVDLSVTSERLHFGRWLEPGIEHRLAVESAEAEAGSPKPPGALEPPEELDPAVATKLAKSSSALLRWGEYRLTRSQLDSRDAPATFSLLAELLPPAGTAVRVPVASTLTAEHDGKLTLEADGYTIAVTGLSRTAALHTLLAAGDQLGVTTAGVMVGVQICLAAGLEPPAFVTADLAAAWARVSPDPSVLLGINCAADVPDPEAMLDRRVASFAEVQEHYFTAPPQIERGWRHHLSDTTARTYVDMLNNVTSIGHGHPRLVHDLTRQWSLLNTNSRFHYALLTELCERLADKAPGDLDTVLLVNSGSEAVDLALRIARTATGRSDVLAVEEGYHGWTFGADAVTSSVADNPNALDTRPDWVHLVSAPNSYRGVHRGRDSGAAYVKDVVERLRSLAERGIEPAAFIAEPFYGNAGGVALPAGYLESVYAAVRAAGGLCIADEVQVGYGRLGTWFWGVEEQGVVPDMITIAKAMGNGHPLGAVITRREIAASFAAEGHFFSSAGGSPVSCQAGLTVLEVIESEDLQGNAARVGGHLKARLEELATRHPLIGIVHGAGLYLGVELVRDRVTLEPAAEETSAICERLLELGVVLQPTGDRRNVLKIKPPLCLTRASADFFADRLDEVLSTGW